MSTLKDQLIKLGSTNPELRKNIRPILAALTGAKGKVAAASDDPREQADFEAHVRAADEAFQDFFKRYSWWSAEFEYSDYDWSIAEWTLYPKDHTLQQATRELGILNDDLPKLSVMGLSPQATSLGIVVEMGNDLIFRSTSNPIPPYTSPYWIAVSIEKNIRNLEKSLNEWTGDFINDWYS